MNLEEDTWQYKRSIYFLKVERDLLGNKSLFMQQTNQSRNIRMQLPVTRNQTNSQVTTKIIICRC